MREIVGEGRRVRGQAPGEEALSAATHALLLTGRPGVGKTTVLRRVAARLEGVRIAGFLTEEIRANGERGGFLLRTFEGREAVMARVGLPGPRVGKYGVDLAVVETLAAAALAVRDETDVYLVDEIGKMECLASGFVAAMRALLVSTKLVVATVALQGGGLIAEAKARPDTQVRDVTPTTRDTLPADVLAWLSRRGVGPPPA